MTPGRDEDRELQRDLDEVSRAWRDGAKEEPPADLDTAVLRSARDAARERRRAWPWTRGWVHNLATAAVVVIAVVLLLQLREETPPPDAPAARMSAEPSARRLENRAGSERVETESKAVSEAAPADMSSTPPPPMHDEAVASADATAVEDRAAPESPDAWLERIAMLKRAGRMEEYRTELAAFREAWPDYPLPDDLLDVEDGE